MAAVLLFGIAVQVQSAGAVRPTLCSGAEIIVFSCRSGAKTVSVCASKEASARKGYLEYRFGDPAAVPELVLPKERTIPRQAARGGVDPFSGAGGAWMKFQQGQYDYTVYSGIGNWGPNGEKREKAGLLVQRGDKQVALFKCAGKYWSELGPDLYDRLGIEGTGEFFDYPD